jgi:uncharacterized membrane protein YgdD (TMEM256/DUF423 family)
MGAAGVALAAVAAHKVQAPGLVAASTIAMVHAAAIVGITAHGHGASRSGSWLAIASLMLVGACLFTADVVLMLLAGTRLFPMAAPTGGATMIISWLALAVVALVDRR